MRNRGACGTAIIIVTRRITILAFVLVLLWSLLMRATVQRVESQSFKEVFIRPNGTVEGTDVIRQSENTYTLNGNLNASIVIEKDNIVLDGAGFLLTGSGNVSNEHGFNEYNGPENETAISLTGRTEVTIKDVSVTGFGIGIALYDSSKCTISGNTLYDNNGYPGVIYLNNSRNNWITQNSFKTCVQIGVGLWYSDRNIISQTRIVDSSSEGIWVYGLNNVVSGNNIAKGLTGLTIGSSHNTIIGNNISSPAEGIVLNRASSNIISQNIISSTSLGIGGDEEAYNNTIFLNTVTGCFRATGGFNNENNSTFYANNFVNNTRNVSYMNELISPIQAPSPQIRENHCWDNCTNGNYWSNYQANYPMAKEVDGTGTYDTPYTVTPPSYPYLFYDYHPLVAPVEISQNATFLPPWATPPANQEVLNANVVVTFVGALLAVLIAVTALVYLKKRKN